jgi:hypothetical protein
LEARRQVDETRTTFGSVNKGTDHSFFGNVKKRGDRDSSFKDVGMQLNYT